MNPIKNLGATVAQVKQCYVSSFCISNNAVFQTVKSKIAVKNIITSKQNNSAGSVLGFNNKILTLLIQKGEKSFDIVKIDEDGDIIATWSETTISKALSRFDGIKKYFVGENTVLRINIDTTKTKLYDINSTTKQKLVYELGKKVLSILEEDFDNMIATLKTDIDIAITNNDYLAANKLMNKLLRTNGSYSSAKTREIELNDLIDFSYNRRVTDRIEKDLNLNSWYSELSTDSDIRIQAAKVLKDCRKPLENYVEREY